MPIGIPGGAGGGVKVVDTRTDAEPNKKGQLFFVDDENNYYGSEDYTGSGTAASLTKRAVVQADWRTTWFGDTIIWEGVLAADPTAPASGSVKFYFHSTERQLKRIDGDGGSEVAVAWTRTANSSSAVFFYGELDSDNSADTPPWDLTAPSIKELNETTDTEVDVLADMATGDTEAARLIEGIAAGDELVFYYDTDDTELYIITAYTAAVAGGDQFRLKLLGGAEVVDTKDDAEPDKRGQFFYVDDENNYYGSEDYPVTASDPSLTKRAVVLADWATPYFTNTVTWEGVLAADPVAPGAGLVKFFFHSGERQLKRIASGATAGAVTWTRGNSLIGLVFPTAVFFYGQANPEQGSDTPPWDFTTNNMHELDETTDTEADVLTDMATGDTEASRMIEAVAADDELVFYYDDDDTELYIITAYDAGTEAGDNFRLKSLGGGEEVGRASDLRAEVGVTVSALPVFSAAMANIASIAGGNNWSDVLSGLTASSLLNIGGFTIETASLRDVVVIPADGNYELSCTMTGLASDSTTGTARSTMVTRFVRERAGVDVALPPQGTPTYSRNQYGEYSQLHGSHMSAVLAFETGDKIRVQALFRTQSSNPTLAIVGAKSSITIIGAHAPTVGVTVNVAGLVGSVIDVSGEIIGSPEAADQGSVWVDTYQHELSFAVRKFRATTIALGTGTEITEVDFISNTQPTSTASDEIWYKPSNGHYHISDADGFWFNTDFDFDTTLTALGLPSTGYTDVVDIGRYDTAGDAANSIPAADYAATTQYVYYNRDTTDIEYLSSYTAPGEVRLSTGISWGSLTDENRITPHPVGDKYEVAALGAVDIFEGTGILLPEIGWIDLVGFVAATGRFALHIPVSLIRGLSITAIGASSTAATSSVHFATGHDMTAARVHFGHTFAGNLLIGSGMLGAVEVSAYN